MTHKTIWFFCKVNQSGIRKSLILWIAQKAMEKDNINTALQKYWSSIKSWSMKHFKEQVKVRKVKNLVKVNGRGYHWNKRKTFILQCLWYVIWWLYFVKILWIQKITNSHYPLKCIKTSNIKWDNQTHCIVWSVILHQLQVQKAL